MDTLIKIIGAFLLAAIAVTLGACFIGIPVYFLWNWLAPDVFGLHVITFGQAIGLSVLCGLLFKSALSSSGDKK